MERVYQVFGEWNEEQDVGKYFAWGIRREDGGALRDISTDAARVKHLVELFNREGLSPWHFDDAVEDWFATA